MSGDAVIVTATGSIFGGPGHAYAATEICAKTITAMSNRLMLWQVKRFILWERAASGQGRAVANISSLRW